MLRIFLRIISVNLHIREPVILEINIRKHQKTITVPNHFPMVNGQSDINATYEFHMTEKNPLFQICVVLCLPNNKKLAGLKEVNLRNVKQQQTIHIQDHLSNCPDPNSIIKFQLMYMASPLNFLSLDLVSEEEVQQMTTLLQLSEIQQQRRVAQTQTKMLQKEYRQLIEENKQLYREIENIEEEEIFTETSWKKELEIQEDRQNQCLMRLEKEKHKMAQILDIVLESGDPNLIDMIQQKIEQISSVADEQINAENA